MKAKSRNRKPLPNGARAIMGSRKESKRSLEYYPTPPFATRALMERVIPHIEGDEPITMLSIWDPACGEGHMAQVLGEYSYQVYSSDIRDYGYGETPVDFLAPAHRGPRVDWIVTNPPYAKAMEFANHAIDIARIGVAMFVRVQFLETIARYQRLFRDRPPTLIAFFVERVAIHKGKWNPKGSTATAYCWLVWIKGREPMPPFWIPPGQRRALTRPDDRARFAAWSLPQAEAAE